MDVPTLSMFLRPILTVTTVLNTGETGDINRMQRSWKSMSKLFGIKLLAALLPRI